MNSIYQNFLGLFNDIKQHGNKDQKEPEILKVVLDYQTTLSWGAVSLSDKIFKKFNPMLSRKWEDLKNNYHI